MKLSAYFASVYEPAFLSEHGKKSGRNRRDMRRAVRLFVHFAGNIEVSAVTADKWRAFKVWLVEIRGLSELASRDKPSMVSKVLAHAGVPWALQILPRGNRKSASLPTIPETFCQGSLLGAYVNNYEPIRLRGKTNNAKRLYRHSLGHFRRFLGREPLLSDLTCETVNRLLSHVRTSGLSPRTVNAIRDRVLALWRYLNRKRLVDEWPDDVPPEVEPERVPAAWSMEDVGRILSACRKATGKIGDVAAADWWECLHRVLLDTGERIAAVLGVTWDAVDLDAGSMLIAAELRKGKRRDRLYELHPDTVAALRRIVGTGNVFPWPFDPAYLYQRYKRLLRSAGLPIDPRSMFHRMRKTVGTYYQAAGGDASAFLDHSDPRITRRYIDPRICKTKSAAAMLPRPVMTE